MQIRERREHRVFRLLVQMIPGLEERLVNSTEAEVRFIAEQVRSSDHFVISMIHPFQGTEGSVQRQIGRHKES
jgi:hypothetical protein